MNHTFIERITLFFIWFSNAKWIVSTDSEPGELGIRIFGLNLWYYKWQTPMAATRGWRVADKREFGEAIKSTATISAVLSGKKDASLTLMLEDLITFKQASKIGLNPFDQRLLEAVLVRLEELKTPPADWNGSSVCYHGQAVT